jgi:hypothetical protein
MRRTLASDGRENDVLSRFLAGKRRAIVPINGFTVIDAAVTLKSTPRARAREVLRSNSRLADLAVAEKD